MVFRDRVSTAITTSCVTYAALSIAAALIIPITPARAFVTTAAQSTAAEIWVTAMVAAAAGDAVTVGAGK